MAEIKNWNDYQAMMAARAAKQANQANGDNAAPNSGSVRFFKLSAGETVVVRFNIATTDDIIFGTVHHAKYGKSFDGNKNKYAPIKCLNDDCPFCKAAKAEGGHPVVETRSVRTFVEMLVAKPNGDGTFTEAVPMIWEKPASFANELAAKITAAHNIPLKDMLFTITRMGATKDDTKYSVDFAMPQIYPDTLVGKDFSVFDNLKIEKFSYYVKTAEEMNTFLETGTFPAPVQTNTEAEQATVSQPQSTVVPQTMPNTVTTVNTNYTQAEANSFGSPLGATGATVVTPVQHETQTQVYEAPKKNKWDFM